jgi:CRP-like cAMP-binding protein
MKRNHLLANLGQKANRHLLGTCDVVDLYVGDKLWDPYERIRYVYYPLDCTISQLLPVDYHESLEMGVIGNEGMLGVQLLLNASTSMLQALVKRSGAALRMNATSCRQELDRQPAFRQQLNRYAFVLQEQLAQSMACVSHHTLDLRLARLLLMTDDREADQGSFHVTHRVLAQTLGVRRVGVTNAAGLLQKRKLLRYSRGDITILDRAGLEKASCACYQASKEVYERVLG